MLPRAEIPLLVYDGDCGFCRRWVLRWQAQTQGRINIAPAEQPADAVLLIEPDWTYSGAEAVFRVLTYAPGSWGRGLFWAYRRFIVFTVLSDWFYRLVARHRRFFSMITRWLWGENLQPPTHEAAREIFIRLLGLVYLFAFASLWTQIAGLIGHDGILPVDRFLPAARAHFGANAAHYFPTLFWLNSSDTALKLVCAAGGALSLLLILGAAPTPILVCLWALYLSLTTAGQDFLGFQWDILLLETGFLAIFLRGAAGLWLLRWLLFKLLFESGTVKLLSGDPAWRNLTALYYHYETQPLPTWVGWYAQQLPHWFQRLSALYMFAVELAAPFLIFLPRRPRVLAFAAIVSLQTLIALTGNYCFFNLLTMALCVLLLDDAFLRWKPAAPARPSRWPAWAMVLVAAVSLLSPSALAPFHVSNRYGLFAVMTTSRPEIIIEGSRDGTTWSEYKFKWKPSDLNSRPRFVAPHQPRLDWQMWFAALGPTQQSPWFFNLAGRLFQGSPAVIGLFANNPFPDSPPRYLRALVYDYHFTNFAQKRGDGAWWRREPEGLFCPVLSAR